MIKVVLEEEEADEDTVEHGHNLSQLQAGTN